MDWSGLSISMADREMEMNSDLIKSITIVVLNEVWEHVRLEKHIKNYLFFDKL
jgi:hypothetical protein